MMNVSLLGIDIAKNVFQLHAVDSNGKLVYKKRLTRDKLTGFLSTAPICTVVMEACGGSNYWARVFQRAGHTVKLISPQYVKPFVKTNKNDTNDAEAIVEAASRPSMNFVPIKQVEQQDIQSLHRIRSRIMKNKIALINEIRGLCLEYGITIQQGARNVRKRLSAIISDNDNELTISSREFMQDLYDELVDTEDRIKRLDKKIKLICKNDEVCSRLHEIPGVGELTATAIIAAVADAGVFKNGRHMSAWLGLVPRQSSSGNKQVLLGISKRGDKYLRTLLIHGARSALTSYKNLENAYGEWIKKKKFSNASLNKAAVALANKNVRIIWSLLKSGERFDCNNEKMAV